jgi:hypothetical protein
MKKLKELFAAYIHKNKRYLNQGEATIITRKWLEEYRQQIQEEDGTPDVKMWFYQAIDELEASLCVEKSKVEQ